MNYSVMNLLRYKKKLNAIERNKKNKIKNETISNDILHRINVKTGFHSLRN